MWTCWGDMIKSDDLQRCGEACWRCRANMYTIKGPKSLPVVGALPSPPSPTFQIYISCIWNFWESLDNCLFFFVNKSLINFISQCDCLHKRLHLLWHYSTLWLMKQNNIKSSYLLTRSKYKHYAFEDYVILQIYNSEYPKAKVTLWVVFSSHSFHAVASFDYVSVHFASV